MRLRKIILVVSLIYFGLAGVNKPDTKIFEFGSYRFTLNETVDEIQSKLDIHATPEDEDSDTIVYMGSVRNLNAKNGAEYESCTIYFDIGRKSKRLGKISVYFSFPRKITKQDLAKLCEEMPVLRK